MNVDYLPINSNLSNIEDTSYLLQDQNSRSKRSSLNSQKIYTKSVQTIEKNKKSLKIFLITIFYIIILSLLYTTCLFMKIFQPEFYLLFLKNCHNKSEMASFLDLILSFFYICLIIYLISILEDVGTPNLLNIKIFFIGLFCLFFVFVKKPDCLYIDFFQFLFLSFFRNYVFVIILNFFEGVVIFYVYWRSRNFFILQQKEYKILLNNQPNGY